MSGTRATSMYADAVALGAQRGLEECREQFQWDRWNCPEQAFMQIFSRDNRLPGKSYISFQIKVP